MNLSIGAGVIIAAVGVVIAVIIIIMKLAQGWENRR